MARPQAPVGTATTAQQLVRGLMVLLGYYLTARLGLLIPYVGTHVSLVWVPTGIAVAALLRWGPAMALPIFVAAAAANAAIGGPLWMAAAVGLGNTCGPWLATRLLQHWKFDSRMLKQRDLGVFLAAALLGMVVTATNGTGWLRAGGMLDASNLPGAWLSWWIGDVVGAILAGVPLVAMNRGTLRHCFLGLDGAVNGVLQGVVLLSGLLAFSPWLDADSPLLFPLLALPFFLVVVLALRGGVLGASLAVLLLSTAAALCTARGYGPFAGHDAHAGILGLWSYISAHACTSLLVCGLATELQSSRRQLGALVRHAHDGVLMIGPDNLIVMVNPAASAMLDIADAMVVGRALQSLPHGNGEMLARWLAQHDGAAPGDLLLTRTDGSQLPVECQAARYRDASGFWQTHLILGDLSARKDAEARLAASEQRLQAIADNLPALVSYIDREHRILFANRTFKDWLGMEPGAMLGRHARELFGAANYEPRQRFVEQAFATGERVSFELELRGSIRHRITRTTYVPDFGPDGQMRGVYSLSMDITDMKAVQQQLIEIARFDHLTGLANRKQFEEVLDAALARCRRSGRPMGLMFLDVDRFKAINDTRGHAAGDAVLREFAQRLKDSVRSTDTVARLAGDEFVVVLEQLHNAEEAQTVTHKIMRVLAAPMTWQSQTFEVTASIGVALADPAGEVSASVLMAAADEALYAAKRAGRNTFVVRASPACAGY